MEGAECRICLQPDALSNLIIPCECKGSQKYAHKVCLKQWMDIKHSDRCGVCKEPYSGIFFRRKPDTFLHYLGDNEGALLGVVIGFCVFLLLSYLLLIGYSQYFTSSGTVPQGLRIILLIWTSFYAVFFILVLVGAIIALYSGFRNWSLTHFTMEVINEPSPVRPRRSKENPKSNENPKSLDKQKSIERQRSVEQQQQEQQQQQPIPHDDISRQITNQPN